MLKMMRFTSALILSFFVLASTAQSQTYYPNNGNGYSNYNGYTTNVYQAPKLSLKDRLLGRTPQNNNNQYPQYNNGYPQQQYSNNYQGNNYNGVPVDRNGYPIQNQNTYPQNYGNNYQQSAYQYNEQTYNPGYAPNQIVQNNGNNRYINPSNYDPVYQRSQRFGGEVVTNFSAQEEIARIQGRR